MAVTLSWVVIEDIWGLNIYGTEECNVMKSWDEKCKNECESVRECE